MGAFAFSPGHCGAAPCDCPACTGSVCVAVVGPCLAADRSGVTLTVKDHATGTTAGTAVTDSNGNACVTSLTPGSYDVTLAKANCFVEPAQSLNQTVTCSTLNIAAKATCLPYGARKYTVLGCFGTPLPDAVVTVTGPVATESVQTGSDGVAYYHYGNTGSYSAVVSHPSGRFADSAADAFTVANVCDSSTAPTITLAPASGYECCDVQKTVTPPSPYPIPKTLKVTDPAGAISFTATNCGGTACAGGRTMTNVATGGGGTTSCNGFTYQLPPTIGSADCLVQYDVSLTATGCSATQTNPVATCGGSGCQYLYGAAPGCETQYLATRTGGGSCAAFPNPVGWGSTGYTINSLYPLNVTLTFDTGGSFGPSATALTKIPPYTGSIVVSE